MKRVKSTNPYIVVYKEGMRCMGCAAIPFIVIGLGFVLFGLLGPVFLVVAFFLGKLVEAPPISWG